MPPEKIKNGWLWPIIGSLAVLVVSPLAVWITGKKLLCIGAVASDFILVGGYTAKKR